MESIDPATGHALPDDALQRVLFIGPAVHVYNIPPLQSTRGHSASTWTAEPQRHIFTARLRLLETSHSDTLKVDVLLEDPKTGALFAASPYSAANAVEPVIDSSRFFAVTVRDPSGKKAVLGIGFEERSEAFDFGVALQEARRVLGWESGQKKQQQQPERGAKDYSLKEGETITVNLGRTGIGRRKAQEKQEQGEESTGGDLQSFALAPPPGGGGFSLPPPPSADDVKRKRRSAQQLGFDDGQFGEFA
ncbi:uncharacterized protein F5Z01DRAFT_627246 [Emericellopsis atlantica]|uniref:NECAP PHear domain-containing protein n=1 Tax=Emericellopsis atlantica TaxID=2614577 RepID=A0A9P8CM18_9HYPO|nr:uncharacterized protein F5Z01DRAFT_627246 [Emericellopsis atlantica]KAG9251610.1 hypothetical protein F5Z01DRAFT_627246 [Emericellopsis atlantica]